MLIEINDFKNLKLVMNIDDAIDMQDALSKMIGYYIKTINNPNIEPHHVFSTVIAADEARNRVAASKITFYIENKLEF